MKILSTMQLRDYQEALSTSAAELLEKYKIACFAIEVRVGKTLIALATAKKINASRVLFVTKLKAISSIEQDHEAFGSPFDLAVTNYEQLHNIAPGWDLVIADECHTLGAFPKRSVRSTELGRVAELAPIIFMSGTFTPESYTQIYHILEASTYSPFSGWSTFYRWAKDFVFVKKRILKGLSFNDYSAANKSKIDEYTAHLFLSYTQAEAGFEQTVEEHTLFVDMREETHNLAQLLLKKKLYIGRHGQEIVADTAVKLQNKIHQIFSGSIILDQPQEAVVIDYSKAHFIRDHFKGQKIAIFYKFIAEKHMLIATFFNRLTDDPDEFNASPDKIFFSQIQSGREGTNLSSADALVMLNIDFSATSYWQSRARMQTKDRTKPARVFWIFARGGIEEKIYAAVCAKKDYTLSHFKKDYGVKTESKSPQTA